jgi:hypothetical protein
VLKTRRVAGVETLILQGTPLGTCAVARDWTDMASPTSDSGWTPTFLRFDYLVALAEMVGAMNHEEEKGVDK